LEEGYCGIIAVSMVLAQGTEENHKSLCQDSQWSSRDWNRASNNNSVALVRELTVLTERPSFAGEVSANFRG
jgi:hypothetical protein